MRAQVLGYHHVDVHPAAITVQPSVFARQMTYLDEQRDQVPVLPLAQIRDWVADRGAPGRGAAIAVTFDDGYADFVEHALPVLLAHRLPATLYVDTDAIGSPGRLTRDEVRAVAAAGVEIGAHTRSHPDLRRCEDSALSAELTGSRAILEDLLSAPVTSLAYPFGLHDARVVRAARAAGFSTAVTTQRAWVRPGVAALRIPRNFVSNLGTEAFAAATRGALNWFALADRPRPPRPQHVAEPAYGGP